jgi:hypothetical protein
VVKRVERACSVCTIAELNELTSKLARELVSPTVEVAPSPPVEPAVIAPATPSPFDSPASDRPYRTWKWGAAGTAAAAIVTGAVLLAIDGDATCDAAAGVECQRLYDTRLLGLATLTVGAGLGGFAVWMFVEDRDTGTHASAGIALQF